jgi:hypothetical protein
MGFNKFQFPLRHNLHLAITMVRVPLGLGEHTVSNNHFQLHPVPATLDLDTMVTVVVVPLHPGRRAMETTTTTAMEDLQILQEPTNKSRQTQFVI